MKNTASATPRRPNNLGSIGLGNLIHGLRSSAHYDRHVSAAQMSGGTRICQGPSGSKGKSNAQLAVLDGGLSARL